MVMTALCRSREFLILLVPLLDIQSFSKWLLADVEFLNAGDAFCPPWEMEHLSEIVFLSCKTLQKLSLPKLRSHHLPCLWPLERCAQLIKQPTMVSKKGRKAPDVSLS